MSTILIVEDHESIQRMLFRRLRRAGYTVGLASNGKEALEEASKLNPDLILMDMHMPIMDGYTATKKLREQKYKGYIIALTASAMIEDTHKALDAGCDHFISKPVEKNFEEQLQKFLMGRNNL